MGNLNPVNFPLQRPVKQKIHYKPTETKIMLHTADAEYKRTSLSAKLM
jgi:hypothetical protein